MFLKMSIRLSALHLRISVAWIPFVQWVLKSDSMISALRELQVLLIAEKDEDCVTVGEASSLLARCGKSLRYLSLVFKKHNKRVVWPDSEY